MPRAFTVNNANWGSAEWVDTGGGSWRAVVQAQAGYYIVSAHQIKDVEIPRQDLISAS